MLKVEKQVVVNREHGLHARPATLFVQLASKFNSSVKIEKDGEAVDGKSIIAVLSLGGNKGMKMKLIAEGEDASEAIADLAKFLEEEND